MKKTLAILVSTAFVLGSLTVYGAASNNEDGDIVEDPWANMYTTETLGYLELPGVEKPTEKEPNQSEESKPTDNAKAPKKTKIKKASKKLTSKKVKVSIKSVQYATGYQLQFSTTKKFKKVIIKVVIKKTRVYISSNKIRNKKKLYIRASAYKLDGNNKVYGKWSKVKRVKIRK